MGIYVINLYTIKKNMLSIDFVWATLFTSIKPSCHGSNIKWV